MRILHINHPQEIVRVMQDMQVDPYGIKIMLPKAITHLIKINSVSNIAANILKQEMLSLGADAAIARGALTGAVKKTDCLLIGNISQFGRLNEKLKKQPFGLGNIGKELFQNLDSFKQNKFILRAGKYKFNLSRRTLVMGIVNVTPDSFSQDGLCASRAVDFAKRLIDEGADIIDIGGESSRPGAKAIPVREELKRVIPVVKTLSRKVKVPISVDTTKHEVARQALENGAVIINDITALKDLLMVKIIAKYNAGVVLMHMKGNPRNMQNKPAYDSLIDDILKYLENAMRRALGNGIKKDQLIIDPGICFGKTVDDNLQILRKLEEFKILGVPILIGTSRKSFIGKILNAQIQERIFGTVSSCVLAANNGARIVRVHDVLQVKQALKILDAINKS